MISNVSAYVYEYVPSSKVLSNYIQLFLLIENAIQMVTLNKVLTVGYKKLHLSTLHGAKSNCSILSQQFRRLSRPGAHLGCTEFKQNHGTTYS